MSLLENGHLLPLDQIAQHRQQAWARQSAYVAENSAFYQRLWDGQTPPDRLEDIAALPLSDKTDLRLSQPASPPFGDYWPPLRIGSAGCTAHPAPQARR